MTSLRFGSSLLAFAICVSYASPGMANTSDTPAPSSNESVANASPPPLATGAEDPEPEPALTWSDLTRLAREHRVNGELDEARERLAQAAIQVRALPPTHARRRTVFGAQARLAIELADAGEIEFADELANELLAEAEAEPELGGAALVDLALSVADRRQPEPQLPVLRVALTTAQAGTTNRNRMDLAFRVADEAYRENEFDLARRAIDQAVLDAQHIGPSRKERIASLELYKSRIALAQGDLEAAESSAIAANQIFEEISASPSKRGIGEATLAEVLATKGDGERALAIAGGAYARIAQIAQIGGEEPIQDHAQRVILASLGRVERSTGDSSSARIHFEEALSIPAVDFPADRHLVKQLTSELRTLDEPEMPSAPPSTLPSTLE